MSEYRRAFQPSGSYFFTVVTHGRRPWLTEESAIERLRQAFRRVMEDRPFAFEAIVILPDHLHCIWQLPEGDNYFPERWRQIKRFVSVGMKSQLNARGEKTLWQRRYWEHLLRNEEDWRQHMDTYTTTRSNMVMFVARQIGRIARFDKRWREAGTKHLGARWNRKI